MNSISLSEKKLPLRLETYKGTWRKSHAAHLIRKTHFSNEVSNLNQLRVFTSETNTVNTTVYKSASTILSDDPSWYNRLALVTIYVAVEDEIDGQYGYINQSGEYVLFPTSRF